MVFQCLYPAYTNRIHREMNGLLSTFFGESPSPACGVGSIAANVWEQDDTWMVEMELPGVTADQLEVTVVNDELTVSVNRPETESEDAVFLRRERPQGPVVRTLQLPSPVDAEAVVASLVHGVLTVTLPKAETARRRKIEVNA